MKGVKNLSRWPRVDALGLDNRQGCPARSLAAAERHADWLHSASLEAHGAARLAQYELIAIWDSGGKYAR